MKRTVYWMLFLFLIGSSTIGFCEKAIVITPIAATTNQENSERDDEVLYGMTGEIIGGSNEKGLYRFRTQYGYETWISAASLLIGTGRAEDWQGKANFIVAVPFADIVPRGSTQSYPPILTLPRGSLLKIPNPNEEGRYFTTLLGDGSIGYIRKNSVRPIRKWNSQGEEATRKSLVADARSYLGSAYRWGGKTTEGIDCSGLASMVYFLNGLNIYRNAEPQAGYPIALMHVPGTKDNKHTLETLAKAKPGDLIYWEGHQGIYIGEGRYIHANAGSFDTRINSLIEGDWNYRADLATPQSIYTWGSAFPQEPQTLGIPQFRAVSIGANTYRFYAKAEGYTPNRGRLYPEGKGPKKPVIELSQLDYMLYESPRSTHASIPTYRYPKGGTYYPVLELINDQGWNPTGKMIIGETTFLSPIVIP